MNLDQNVVRAFLFWVFFVGLGVVVYFVYLGQLNAQFIQIAFLGGLFALSVISLGIRASKLGKTFIAVLAICWLVGINVLFALVPVDPRLSMLLLLAISLSLNAALSVVIKRRAIH